MKKLVSPQVIVSIILAVIVIILYFSVKKLADRYAKKHRDTGEKATIIRVLFSILRLMVFVIGILVILQINGINITALIAGLGIASAIVGLSLQDYFKDIIMGIHIISDHFFSVGECVEYDGREGVVIGMTLKTTKIGDLEDHAVTTICNRNISEIRRLAERMDIDIPLRYEEDVRKVHETLSALSEEIADLEDVTKCEYKGTQSFESSAVLYKLRVFCNPQKRADVRRAAVSILQAGLREAEITIPYGQLDVHCNIKQ